MIKKSKIPNKFPKAAPKGRPKRTPKAAPEIVPEAVSKQAPKVDPKRRSTRRPIIAPEAIPENTIYLAYDLPYYDTPGHPGYRKCHPKFYGQCRGEFITERDAKEYLRSHELYGHFAIAERVNNRLGLAWHIEIEEPEEIEIDAGEDLDAEDLAEIEESDFADANPLNDPVVKLGIENAELKAELKAASRNGHSSSIGELLQGLRALDDMRGGNAPAKSLSEQLREAKELVEIVTPRRENPAPALAPAPPTDPKIAALQLIAENPEVMEKIGRGIASTVLGAKGDSDVWADVAMEVVRSGQAAQIVKSAVDGLGTLLGSLLRPAPAPAPIPPQYFVPQAAPIPNRAPAPQAAPIPPNGQPAPVPPAPARADEPADQAPPAQVSRLSAEEFLYTLIAACEQKADIAEVKTFVNLSLIRNPDLSDSLDNLLNLPIAELVALAKSIHPPIAQLPHAEEWLAELVDALTAEGGEFDEVTEVKVKGKEVKL